MRQTSIDAFNDILASGLIGDLQREVVRALYKHGQMTETEIDVELKGTSYHKRLSELERLGVVEIVGQRPCRVTTRIVNVWALTGNRPTTSLTAQAPAHVAAPTARDLFVAEANLRQFVAFAAGEGLAVADETKRALAWLRHRARCPTCGKRRV